MLARQFQRYSNRKCTFYNNNNNNNNNIQDNTDLTATIADVQIAPLDANAACWH